MTAVLAFIATVTEDGLVFDVVVVIFGVCIVVAVVGIFVVVVIVGIFVVIVAAFVISAVVFFVVGGVSFGVVLAFVTVVEFEVDF